MTTSPIRSIATVGLLTVLTGCGLASHGGIIDNGNQPSDPHRPNPHRPSDQTQPTTSDEPMTQVAVLSDYVVDVPSKWAPEAALESNILSFNGQAILFAEGTEVCDATPRTNDFQVEIYACSPTMTVLRLGEGHYVVAKHRERTEDIDLVLYSFRSK